jgi:hypothetical protein
MDNPEKSRGHVLWFRDPVSGVLCELVNCGAGYGRAPASNALDATTKVRALRWEGPEHQRDYILRRFRPLAVDAALPADHSLYAGRLCRDDGSGECVECRVCMTERCPECKGIGYHEDTCVQEDDWSPPTEPVESGA